MTLFHHNPPSQRELQQRLFVNRSREMRKLNEKIRGGFDTASILVIHGDSRVGKSHLALNFLATLDDTYHKYIIKAAGGRTARLILVDLYQDLRQRVLEVSSPVTLQPEDVESLGILQEGREIINLFDGLICGGEQSREFIYGDTFESTRTFRLLTSAFAVTPELNASEKTTRTTTKKVVLAPPDEYRLVDILRELCELLTIATNKKNLIYIDDVDLLDDGPSIDQEQVIKLVRLLHRLAESNDVAIVASMRTRHLTIAQKELSEALTVRGLGDDEFQEVYRRHIASFHENRPVFDDACLTKLTEFASRRIGNFLRLCSKLFDWGDIQERTQSRLIAQSDLEDFIKDEIRDLSRNLDYSPYLLKIREAAKSDQLEVELDAKVLGTPLIFLLLEEPINPSQTQQRYGIFPLVARVIKEMELGRTVKRTEA